MKLCDTCTKTNCKKRIVIIQEDNLITTKCLDYEKDKNKIKGYKKQLERTAKVNKSVMGLYDPSWD
jgi:hypothetical protein|nr:MAG TPA: hypothetical protein [Caudoviricetes sp.]